MWCRSWEDAEQTLRTILPAAFRVNRGPCPCGTATPPEPTPLPRRGDRPAAAEIDAALVPLVSSPQWRRKLVRALEPLATELDQLRTRPWVVHGPELTEDLVALLGKGQAPQDAAASIITLLTMRGVVASDWHAAAQRTRTEVDRLQVDLADARRELTREQNAHRRTTAQLAHERAERDRISARMPTDQFEARQSDDPAKRDLELTCIRCRRVVCDIEHGDSLLVLADTAATHTCPDDPEEGEKD
ncbi:hypothetical protein [Thermomonospora cellulosilytica]|uniref:Uncharacterized protein n=1 Tax=Thermomonospora cellulosilytica TaxID=1411118 RepID=A0A7W3N1K5_9ACTN|nr:hypothetical protein [Thermomonospora cellulosilytica]MBA9005856.1 hypothetical protein [Thermomonospora cellulosilytica]